MSLDRFLNLMEGLEHSTPEGRDDAAMLHNVLACYMTMRDALERVAGYLCGESMSQQDKLDAYAVADAALTQAEGVL